MRSAVKFCMILCLLPSLLWAADKDIPVTVVLNHIKVHDIQDLFSGDELYFDIAENRQQKRVFTMLPEFPQHWPSNQADKLKKITLWHKPLKVGEKITLTFSLMDRDVMKLNPDDLIGSIQLRLSNEEGVLKSQWSIPNRTEGPEVLIGEAGEINKFELYGLHAKYDVYLSLKTGPLRHKS